ncbi:MAG: pirin family protein [Ghiorsea sp.]|nr:pirin family protein [Ghiorsea sp.]
MQAVQSISVLEGEAILERRLMPTVHLPHLDPFMRVEHFFIEHGGFPNQPHHGFEGLFYLFSGELHHDDSLGNHEDIYAGGVELFNTGHGLLHAEMVESKAHGLRIWFDLPEHMKHSKPTYQKFDAEDIPLDATPNVIVRTVVGKGSPVETQVKAQVIDITMGAKSVYMWNAPEGVKGFVYVAVGQIRINGKEVNTSEAMIFSAEATLPMITHTGARVIVCCGEPNGGDIEVPTSYAT